MYIENTNRRGFTLIELMVVLGIIIFMVPSVFGLMNTLMRQQSRVVALQEIKRNGDTINNHIKSSLRNTAVYIYSSDGTAAVCATAGSNYSSTSNMFFRDKTNLNTGGFYYSFFSVSDYNAIAYGPSGYVGTVIHDTGRSKISPGSFSMSCTRLQSNSLPIVTYTFTVYHPVMQDVTLKYRNSVKLRDH